MKNSNTKCRDMGNRLWCETGRTGEFTVWFGPADGLRYTHGDPVSFEYDEDLIPAGWAKGARVDRGVRMEGIPSAFAGAAHFLSGYE